MDAGNNNSTRRLGPALGEGGDRQLGPAAGKGAGDSGAPTVESSLQTVRASRVVDPVRCVPLPAGHLPHAAPSPRMKGEVEGI